MTVIRAAVLYDRDSVRASRNMVTVVRTLWGEKRLLKQPPTPDQIGAYLLHMRPWEYRLDKMLAKSNRNCPVHRPSAKVVNYRILLAGESGLGKTTMMHNLFRAYRNEHERASGSKVKEYAKTKLQDFVDPALRRGLQKEFSVTFPEPNCHKIKVNFFLQASCSAHSRNYARI
jgi:Cdc6-like AAA superfamily ATPase